MSQKVAYVTGGMGGIGTAICQRLHKEGFKVVAGCGPTRDFQKWLDEQKALGYSFYASVGNVGDWDSTVEAFAKTKAEHGSIDVLVNNAGITRDALIQKMTDDDWDAVINVNLKGVFVVTRAVAPVMMETGSGSIVTISSVVGLDGNIGQSNYAATKGGVIAMTKGWAKEFARKGAKVRANALSPGYTRTPMIESVPAKVIDPIIARTPLGRLAEIQDIANGVLFLASDESSFITGQVLRVDGGLVL